MAFVNRGFKRLDYLSYIKMKTHSFLTDARAAFPLILKQADISHKIIYLKFG